MKIKISNERITHYQALCHDCGWVEADHVDREWIRQEVHKHIRKTGHSVSIEKGTSTLYQAAEQKRAADSAKAARLARKNKSKSKKVAPAKSG